MQKAWTSRVAVTALETLETRRLMSGNAGEILLGEDGVLRVTGTNGRDELIVGTDATAGTVYARVVAYGDDFSWDSSVSAQFDAGAVKGIVADAGDGDDYLAVNDLGGLLSAPVTMRGGSGDDRLEAEADRDGHDYVIAHRGGGPFAPMVLEGGDGNDELCSGIGDVTLAGGNGDDKYLKWLAWGAVTVVDDVPRQPEPTPEPAPAPVADGVADDEAVVEPEVTVGPVAAVRAPVFSATRIAPVSAKFFDASADELW
ncbi:MAG: hypothetical protein ACAI43_19690 [Phycisphaerae bacterium]|nr:hypothetical protein [Tepidisphaeraceae bacterium]